MIGQDRSGEGFLAEAPEPADIQREIHLVAGWYLELERLVPSGHR